MADAKQNPTQLMVFLGSVYHKGKRYARFAPVTQADLAGVDETAFNHTEAYTYNDCRKSAVLTPGAIYQVEYPEGKQGESVFSSTFRYFGEWQNKKSVVMMVADEKILVATEEAAAENKKAAKVDPLKRQLLPVRKAYRGAVGGNRAQLLAWVVAYVTGALEE